MILLRFFIIRPRGPYKLSSAGHVARLSQEAQEWKVEAEKELEPRMAMVIWSL